MSEFDLPVTGRALTTPEFDLSVTIRVPTMPEFDLPVMGRAADNVLV